MNKKFISVSIIFAVMINAVVAQSNDLSESWETDTDFIFLNHLEEAVVYNIDSLSNIAGLLISKNGNIIFENYYNGSYREEIYPVFSVTKSFLSTLVGQAHDMGLIPDPNLPMSNFLNEDIDYLNDITLSNLLTMTSGYIPIDNYLYATTYELANASHSSGPGSFFYQNPACHLISHVIFHNTGLSPYYFADVYLFPQLGISDPFWHFGWNYINDGGNGLWLNLRDMSKLGQLYIQDGYSGDNQILSSEWIEQATSSAVSTGLQPLSGYGYLFWIPDVQSTYFEGSFFIMGTGGQIIFVSPKHKLLIATHSHLYPENAIDHENKLFYAIWDYLIPIFKLGDLNNDTLINIIDILKISDSISDSLAYSEEADLNNDNIIDINDINSLVSSLLRISF